MKRVVLSLGSNLQNRQDYILKSAELINYHIGNIIQRSRIYETESWGFASFPFLNQILIVLTDLSPEEVLVKTQQIENELGRTQKTESAFSDQLRQYHDRTIDIDILLFEGIILQTPRLVIPHPLIQEREFILRPLAELFGNKVIPPFQESFHQLLINIKCLSHYEI
ncbi:MAG TPA: 2-amino-4-hydroxy-6-hydroxymethyldihydropteridine diphosphokinase [Bacteroidales bacterium]|nr:2-amino-4-hydroxy-6-hydroxymethyldihydropteridine diphosphokinase [Bacteroidales bacterium]HPT51967.1 2-amino-4-hydroxy-6-hydroxymethyldihydropteridine diphosphokinase [Bacteroidales bacterium]